MLIILCLLLGPRNFSCVDVVPRTFKILRLVNVSGDSNISWNTHSRRQERECVRQSSEAEFNQSSQPRPDLLPRPLAFQLQHTTSSFGHLRAALHIFPRFLDTPRAPFFSSAARRRVCSPRILGTTHRLPAADASIELTVLVAIASSLTHVPSTPYIEFPPSTSRHPPSLHLNFFFRCAAPIQWPPRCICPILRLILVA
ncbi:hypothetical protein FB451DRAFT_1452277 [Mycena latifolia]|nr:hypothetical protein FB451DRAFT_1452277 [Mycena latifolia]